MRPGVGFWTIVHGREQQRYIATKQNLSRGGRACPRFCGAFRSALGPGCLDAYQIHFLAEGVSAAASPHGRDGRRVSKHGLALGYRKRLGCKTEGQPKSVTTVVSEGVLRKFPPFLRRDVLRRQGQNLLFLLGEVRTEHCPQTLTGISESLPVGGDPDSLYVFAEVLTASRREETVPC
jgi:hypothetical protein